MSNNLRQIAKDLRSFVKRCKDVHYSDSLLISFLITGLLTIAPKLHADVASEQQEITAQTYDAITDLRQSFMRARKENEKSLKGAQSELVQLLKQGDQVIKSPWASFQFGTGYINNDWGTTYRGRGGKFLEYFRRNNDLTKYVFDKDKHLYGATNLNIPRNQEPDALTINPANVYKAYEPTEVIKLDAMTLPTAPEFNPQTITPNSGYYKPFTFNAEIPTNYASAATKTSRINIASDNSSNALHTATTWNNNTNNNSDAATITTSNGEFYNTYYSDNGVNSSTYDGNNSLNDWQNSGNNNSGTLPYGATPGGNITTITGFFRSGQDGVHSNGGGASTGSYWASQSDTWYGFVTVNNEDSKIQHSGAGSQSGLHGRDMTESVGYYQHGGGGYNPKFNTWNDSFWRPNIIFNNNTSGLTVTDTEVTVGSSGLSDANLVPRSGIKSTENLIISNTTNGTAYLADWWYDKDGNEPHNYDNSHKTGTAGSYGGIHTVKRSGTQFKVQASNSNGILFDGNGKTLTVSNSGQATTFNVSGAYSNGINMKRGTADVYNSTFTTSGSHANGIYLQNGTTLSNVNATFEVNGTDNNGILANNATITNANGTYNVTSTGSNGIALEGTSTLTNGYGTYTVSGNNSNGIVAESGTTLTNVDADFTVSGSNSNGILKNTNTNTTITGSDFTVSGTGATGVTYNGGSNSETIGNSTFTVSGGNNSAGVHMINADKITFNHPVIFNVNEKANNGGGSIGLEIDNNGIQAKTVIFNNAPGLNNETKMILTGKGNTAVNIHGGNFNSANAANTKVDVTTVDGLDIIMHGNENIGYNNTGYAKELKIESGHNAAANTLPLNSASGVGMIFVGGYNPGNPVTGYDKNVIFANQGYVESGSVKLNHIEVNGDDNTIAYFASGRGNYMNNGQSVTGEAGVGLFNGNGLVFQGIIGRYALADGTTSKGNVGVYASSGQRSGLNTNAIIGQNPGVNLNNLAITNFNVGAGPKAENTTLIYANNGTVVEVSNSNAAASGALIANVISDGVNQADKNYWGYAVPYNNASLQTTVAYAEGVFANNTHNFIGNFPNGGAEDAPSEVIVKSHVDMVSKEGIAYHAKDGARVTMEKGTRAGGSKSTVAYAEGTILPGVTRSTMGNGNVYQTMKGAGDQGGSSVVIKGNIIAADNMLFSTTQDAGANNDFGPATNRNANSELYKAYQNTGAYATNGGDVIIKGTGAAAITAAGTTLEHTIVNDKTENTNNKSLIYGLGAYASGKNSNVIFTSKNAPGANATDAAAATIVTGTSGALYAEKDGYIEFNGEIVHQNNIGVSVKTGDTTTDGNTIGNSEVRGGRGLIYDTSGNLINDHKDVPIFFVNRSSSTDTAGITFNDTTQIDLYDGILLTGDQYYHGQTRYWNSAIGNDYNGRYSDYYKEADYTTTSDKIAWDKAKYRGMESVTVNLVNMGGDINLGLVNQASKEIEWDSNQDKTAGNFLKGIGEFAGGMTIKNESLTNNKSTSTAMGANSSIINGKFKISTKVDLSDNIAKNNNALFVSGTANKISNDPFNNIKMESEYVTIDSGALVAGDGTNLAGQGLSMANSLFRWDKDNVTYRRSKNTESGYENSGKVNVWGGSDTSAVTGINVAYGTIENKDSGKVYVDHGNALVGTDGSILTNKGKIVVTGLYDPATQSVYTSGITNAPIAAAGRSVETTPKGENYGIVGISTKDVLDHNNYNRDRYGENKVNITNIADGANGTIEVAGEMAVGIYANNVNQKNYIQNVNDSQFAKSNDVTVEYDNQNATSADAIKLNYGTNGTAKTPMQQNKALHGVGIALVETDKDFNAAYRGGIINLNTKNNGIGQTADILTFENGIGVYGESAKINFKGDSTGLTVDTGSEGAGIWVTDDSTISSRADRLGTPKTLNYNYKGYNDKKGFGMIFGSTDPNNRYGGTTAANYLDIKFNNNSDTGVDLTYEKSASKVAAVNTSGTYKGIAGMLVNTDANDSVYNYGDIKEDTSKTNVRAYGAVVNKGRLVNYGNIELNDSLNVNASSVEKADLKKVNAGILANDHTTASNTWIENYGDIKVGSTSRQNVGGYGIYGYNIITGEKADHSTSTITVNSNSYGIYSGDGTVKVQKGTKLLVGNDTVLGHVQTTTGKAITTNPSKYPISRQSAYSQATDLLPGRTTDAAYGVYIGDNTLLSGGSRNVEVSADMDIDRYSYGIVLAKNAGAEAGGTSGTTVKIGSGSYTLDAAGKVTNIVPTNSPTIVLAANKNAGGLVISTAPSDPKVPEEVYEQGNAVYYYSADKNSKASSFANVTMNGDYNTAYYTAGSVDNFGTIDLRSQNNLLTVNGSSSANLGYGNLGIVSTNPNVASTNYGTIITSMSDTSNQKYSAGMAAGRNIYNDEGKFVKVEDEGNIVNRGTITVSQDEGIGMFATGSRSKAVNYGTIDLQGKNSIGMYLDRGAQGENYGTIMGDGASVKGVVAINNGYIKNYGTIKVTGTGSIGILTDNVDVKTDNEDSGANPYKGTEVGDTAAIKYVNSGDVKTTGVGTTISVPDAVPLTKISVDGIDTPIFDVESDAAGVGDWAKNITVSSSIQTGGTRIIDLSAKNEWGNPVWEHAYKEPLSEVTSIGMYVDTSGVRYTNPIDGIQNLPHLSEVNLYFGPEATLYTNSKAIRIGDKVDVNGNVTKSNILKPFNDALSQLSGGAIVNPLSASLTWQVKAKLDSNNQLSEIYMSKVPYHSFAYDNDKSLVNFTNNLDNIYEIAKQESAEKVIFNKLNSLGNGEGHILAQAFDQMRGHIYGGVQQRIKSTSDILTGEMNGLRSDRNVSKDSNKFKAFGQRNEFKTDTAGMPDWYSNAGGFAFVHEDETVRLGQSSGWSAGVVNNYFTFKDLSKSYENQAMAKVGVFKTIPLDANGTFVLSLGGDGFFGRNDMKRRFWVVDQEFRAKASYYSYGAGLNAGLEKAFVINDGFSIVPNVGIRAEYGRFSSIHENGDMALNVKSDDYVSVKPSAGIDFRYSQEVFKNSNLTASLGFAYENEIGKLYDVENEARIVGAWTDYFGIRGDKEDKRGNFKSDLKLGLDNGRFGFNVNTGYDSKGHNFRAGLGLKVLY